jgi:ribonuclease HI
MLCVLTLRSNQTNAQTHIAEYEVVILGLRKLRALGVTTCIVKTDSKIVAGQIEEDCSVKEPLLMQYLLVVRSLKKQFKGFTLHHKDRNKNEEADMLAKAAAKGKPLPSDVFIIVNLIMTEDRRAPMTLYLQGHSHPTDQAEAKRLKHRSRDFVVIDGQLYKKGISQPMLVHHSGREH